MIQIKCPKCQMLLQLTDSAAGTVVACAKCGQQMKLGGLPPAPLPAPAQRVNPTSPVVHPPAPASPPPPSPRPVESDAFAGIGSPGAVLDQAESEPDFGHMVEEARKSDTTNQIGELWAEVPQPLPYEVEVLGYPLDAFRSEGRKRKLSRVGTSAFAIWLGISGAALVIAFRTGKSGPVLIVLALSGAALLVLLAVTFLQVGIVLALARTYRVFVFADAVVYQAGSEFRVLPWKTIQFVEYSSFTDVSAAGLTRVRHSLVVAADNGEQMDLDEELIGVDRLADRVLNQATARQLGPVMDLLSDGRSVQVGLFRLDLSGLHYREESHAWDEFDRCVLRKGRLCFRLRNEDDYCIEVETAKTPRAFLVHAVARSFIPQAG